MKYSLFASCAKGLEYLLQDELQMLGLQVTQVSPFGVYGQANTANLYTLCLWSRLANRIQLLLFSGDAHNDQGLYKLCHAFPWQTIFTPDKTLSVEFHGSSTAFRNSMYGAQVIKDAVVDHFKKVGGTRPTVDKDNPQIRLHAYLKHDTIQVSLDLTGYSLHQRGYRTSAGAAPLKETLAAALLIRAKWPELASEGYAFQDPLCGSGTLIIEAAMMAANIAPGLIRTDQSFIHWLGHQPSLWEKMRAGALKQVKPAKGKIKGGDLDPSLIAKARENASRAGVLPLVDLVCEPLKEARPIAQQGLLLCNPPYGERLGESNELIPLYQEFGKVAHDHFQGWQAAFLTSDPWLAKVTGLRSPKQYTFYNGALECKLYCMHLSPTNRLKRQESKQLSAGATMLVNRLQKNKKNLDKWLTKHQITAYRIYDADLPEYAYAIDLYNNYAILQEYAPPATISSQKAEKHSFEVIQAVPVALEIPFKNLIVKQRKRQKGNNQYQKMSQHKERLIVQEGHANFLINLYDYLDSGLFLDHRPLRRRFAELPSGTRFLNLFCYTATASVQAALAGAVTTNVDLSATYLQWAQDNFKLNDLAIAKHSFVQANCMDWLKRAPAKFDVIFLDPPTFSNSKRMAGHLDIQRDHPLLIDLAMRLLSPGGYLYFSTNSKYFNLSPLVEDKWVVKNISQETIDIDFKRNPRIHQCFMVNRPG